MTSFLKTLRQSVDNLRRDRGSSLSRSQNNLASQSELPRAEDIDFQYKIVAHCNGCVIWNHKLYVSNQDEIHRVDTDLQLHPFAADEVSTIVTCSEFGKLVHGLRGITIFKGYLLSWHETGAIVLWSENEQIILQFDAHVTAINNVVVWKDHIISRSRDTHDKVKVWDVDLSENTAKCILTLDDPSINYMVPWNDHFATLSLKTERAEDAIRIYDSNLRKVNTFTITGTHIRHIYPWKELLVCSCEDGFVYLLSFDGNIESRIGSEGTSDVWAFCVWQNNLVFCDAILKNFNLSQGVIEMWDAAGVCEYKLKCEHAACELIPWDDLLVARTCDSIVVYKDKRPQKEANLASAKSATQSVDSN